MHKELSDIWKDQQTFNQLLRGPEPTSLEERTKLSKDIALCQYSEIDSLLQQMQWKAHRRQHMLHNHSQVLEELIDQFKLWMTQCQIWGFTLEDVLHEYWKKSAAVHVRYEQEWTKELTYPIAIIDIDGVLCDYSQGFGLWMRDRVPLRYRERVMHLIYAREWLSAESIGILGGEWESLKHQFRSSGQKRRMPVFSDAKAFLRHLRSQGYTIVLLTSRPIDRYPNLFVDTVDWLRSNTLMFDFIYWSANKMELLFESINTELVAFAVDDDLQFIKAYQKAGIASYWVRRGKEKVQTYDSKDVTTVSTLDVIRL